MQKPKKLSKKRSIVLLEKMSFYLDSGMPIDVTIETCTREQNINDLNLLNKIKEMVLSGQNLSFALAYHTKLSNSALVMLKAGEKSQNLNKSISQVLTLAFRNDELKKKILSSMTYPVVIGFFAFIVTIGLVKGILPQIIPMLKSLNVTLPLLTRLVIGFSDTITDYGLYILLLLFVSFIVFPLVYSKSKTFRRNIHRSLLKVPILGSTIVSYDLSSFCSAVSSMLDSGMTFVEAYSEAIQIPSNIHISEKIESNIRDLYEGASVSKIFMSLGLFSNDLIALIQAGQQSGRLSYAFIRCAQSLEYNLDHKLKRLTSLLEPALMISMGIIIGSIALSIMLPIYEMSKSLQK